MPETIIIDTIPIAILPKWLRNSVSVDPVFNSEIVDDAV